jgi:3-isopropylmalate/(R)-2-methylmalate dehydratase small subunit
MEAIDIIRGTAAPMLKDNIDTDQIIPKQFLKRVGRTGYGKDLFHDWRSDPDFVLNRPERAGAGILIAGENFGCGSSREHAVWALAGFGFRAVIAGGYSDIFAMNSVSNGLLAVRLPREQREALAALPPAAEIEIDLPAQEVRSAAGTFTFDIAPDWKQRLLEGLDPIAATLKLADRIDVYERRIPAYRIRTNASGTSGAADGIAQEVSA